MIICSHICYTVLILVFGKVTLGSVDHNLVINVIDRGCPVFLCTHCVHYLYSSETLTVTRCTLKCYHQMLTTMKDPKSNVQLNTQTIVVATFVIHTSERDKASWVWVRDRRLLSRLLHCRDFREQCVIICDQPPVQRQMGTQCAYLDRPYLCWHCIKRFALHQIVKVEITKRQLQLGVL